MATTATLFLHTLLSFLFIQRAFSTSEPSPAPSPQLPADSPLYSPPSPSPLLSPSVSPISSPPAPPPLDLAVPGDTPTPVNSPDVPAPSPTEVSDVSHDNLEADGDAITMESSGMSGGKKAGILLGVIAAACLVGLVGLVYKKRQQNIRRSHYGYAARTELL